MSSYKLPSKLQRHFANLSATIQTLFGECILAIEGLDAEPNRNARTEFEVATLSQKSTEQIAAQLQEFLSHKAAARDILDTVDGAIAVAAASGKSTREIAEFYGYKQRFVMRRLCAVQKLISAARVKPRSRPERFVRQLAFAWFGGQDPNTESDGAEIAEVFAMAQRRRV